MKYKPFWQPTEPRTFNGKLLISTWTMNICLQTKFKHWNVLANFGAKFTPNFWTWKRNWQVCNELGNRALKSDLKSTIKNAIYFRWFQQGKVNLKLVLKEVDKPGNHKIMRKVFRNGNGPEESYESRFRNSYYF
jgi:hypothetical protein